MKNALTDLTGLPRFSDIRVNEVIATIEGLIDENRKQLKELIEQYTEISQPEAWQAFSSRLQYLQNRLDRAWSPVSHMNSVVNSEELRKVYDHCLAALSSYQTELAQNGQLYAIFSRLRQSEIFEQLSQAQRKVIENTLLKFSLNGVALDKDSKEKFSQLKKELSACQSRFEQNLLDATQAFRIHIDDKKQLKGLPDYIIDMARDAAREESLKGWLFTLDAPSYLGVMTFSDIRKFREEMYCAYVSRASAKGPNGGEFDNSALMEDILNYRKQMAEILSYDNYAELSIADKMAETTQEVLDFLYELVERCKTQGQQEYKELVAFAKKHCDIKQLEAWDIMYVSEKLKQKDYGISQQELKAYFPVPTVLKGLFEIVHRLYGIQIKEKQGVDVWHKDVSFYEIYDEAGELRGQFYLDLYSRSHKRGGAWMDECIVRMKDGNNIQIPVAYLVCNLSPPSGNKPALLGHDEVTTLFHEFGHGLQHMLTQVDELQVAGINGVEWDAVELPSQFMENWCWEKEALQLMSCHIETGEPVPDDLYTKLLKARNFQSAMLMLRQLEFSIFDFRLHMEYGSEGFKGIQQLLDEVRQQVAVIIPPEINQFQHGFAHIFSGGYAAGYYSYKWAEVLSADAFEKFEENGIFDRKTGKEFMQHILQTGGSEKAMELYRKFRGREPKIDALLKHNGLARIFHKNASFDA